MIHAKEMRIGNYYNWRGGDAPDEGYDEQFKTKDFIEIEEFPSRYRPILFTEDRLIKFGFEKESEIVYVLSGTALAVKIWKVGSSIEYICFWGSTRTLHEIQFLHQFQNMHYALTGKELIFKPTQP